MSASAPLENFVSTPKKSFATQSPRKQTWRCAALTVAMGQKQTHAVQNDRRGLAAETIAIFIEKVSRLYEQKRRGIDRLAA
jgi:hypothetical protein